MDLERELHEAIAAARAAGEYALREYASFTPVPDAPASISTHVDREAQEIILRHLRVAFPADGLVAEEATPTLTGVPAGGRRVWVVDPIDGTRGFAMKNGEFSVLVGLTVDRRPVVGVVLEPVPGRLTYAAAGGGCWVRVGEMGPTRCRVTDRASLDGAVLVHSRPSPGKPPRVYAALRPNSVIETYSAGVKLALVARGEGDLYVSTYFNDWDVCAGQVLVEEAGGRVSLFDGRPLTYGAGGSRELGGLLASNGRVHDEAVRGLAGV